MLMLSLFAPDSSLAQQGPGDPAFRMQVQRAIMSLRSDMAAMPQLNRGLDAAKFANDDSLRLGGIAGRIEGITEADSAWVLAIAAHVTDDPTAWKLGEVKSDGEYLITGLKTGTYIVMAGAEGFFPMFFRHGYAIWEAEPIEVAPGDIRNEADFHLEPLVTGEGAISGHVFEKGNGMPIRFASVIAYSVSNPFVSAEALTNDDGSYTLSNLRTGQYRVYAYAEGYFGEGFDPNSSIDEIVVTVEDGQEVTDVNFHLSPGGTISGTLTDGDGNPISRATINAFPPSDREPYPDVVGSYGWATTDENGNYKMTGLFDGAYIVSAQIYEQWFSATMWYDDADQREDATPVPVSFGEETTGIDFKFDLTTDTGSLSGRITAEDGTPVQEAWVRLESIDSPNFYYHQNAFANERGEYVFEEVPIGTYRVVLEYWTSWHYGILWYDQASNPEDATPVEIAIDQRTENINFTLPATDGTLEGTVVDLSGRPVANAYIQLSNSDIGRPFYGGDLWAYATTDAAGNFRIENLPDGEYFASMFFCYFHECTEQWWPESRDPASAEAIVITGGKSDPATVDFTLPFDLGTASISGVVQHTNGQPLTGAQVSVMPFSNITPGIPEPWSTQLFTTTDSLGAYAFNYLPAGTFIVHTSYWEDGGYAEQWYDGVTSPPEATQLILADGDKKEGIDFNLDVIPLYGSVSGQVFFEDGSAIGRAYVEAVPYYRDYEDRIWYPAEQYAITSDDGSFTIENLYQGEYQINVYAQGAEGLVSDSLGYDMLHIKIAGGETTVVEVAMRRLEEGPGEISGVVTGEQGDILEIAVVRAMPVVDFGPAFYTAITDENGNYRLNGLPEGEYYILTMAPWHVSEYYDDTYDPEEARLVPVTVDRPAAGIDIALNPMYFFDDSLRGGDFAESGQSSVIFGTVTDDKGNALADATVYVMDENGAALLSAQTHGDGMYEITNVPPGATYRVKASRIGYKSQFNEGAADMAAAPALTMSGSRFELNFTLGTDTQTGVEKGPLPETMSLLGNYPNPFRNETIISLSLPEAKHVQITVYDALGREIENLYEGSMPSGANTVRWTPSDAGTPSGLYFYRITDGQRSLSGKMMLMR